MTRLACLILLATVLACGGAATGQPATQSPGATEPTQATIAPSPTQEVLATLRSSTEPSPTPTLNPSPVAPQGPTQQATRPPEPTELPEAIQGPVVKVGNAEFQVELAITPEEQMQGLSLRPSLAAGTAMLFVYRHQSRYRFWMKDMQFPLDIVWIGSGCNVVDVTLNATPEPDLEPGQLPRYSPEVPAQYVLEINAGEAGARGIKAGVPVEFTGDLAGQYGC